MNLLNENRRKLYRKNPELYPGDISQSPLDYQYQIPIITAFTKLKVSFTKENGEWYFDYPNYPFLKGNLRMILGSDKLLDLLVLNSVQKSGSHITIEVTFSNEPLCNGVPQPIMTKDYYRDTFYLVRDYGSIIDGFFIMHIL